ncbi:P-loop NTPase [Catenulispora sp. NF23]|uniref:P-loop NTPase n=1 Tax=Catenulispora pinistramenti TaxID=2705254 RepID=A0ABS5KKD7_9ACTN|nr:septum site-determining protein Ssd [Catenulispora pinistramenti]MBS2531309.1 P-loop NTPase [Catenulispora pinistramenti]MBS2545991.1 P-loop NTPase [Catenulispora pinistramenti]
MRDLTQHPGSGRPGRTRRPDPGAQPGQGPAAAPAPLAVTADPALADALLRIAAEAGVRIEIVPGPSAARRRWAAAPLVLIGADQTGEVARAGLPRRPEVALIGRDLDDASVWQRGSAVGAAHVLILPDCERWLAGMLAEADSPREEPGAVVAVLSGRGGAGGSTLAAALALAGTRRGLRSTLVDLDPAGGGIDLLFGLETEPGPRWSELAQWRDGRLCGRSLREALPTYAAHSRHGLAAGLGFTEEGADRLPVLAWPRARPGEDDGPGWLGARPGADEDPWYDSGSPADPAKADPWLSSDPGVHGADIADGSGNPLFGPGAGYDGAVPDIDDDLWSGGGSPSRKETAGPHRAGRRINADGSSAESLSRASVIALENSDSEGSRQGGSGSAVSGRVDSRATVAARPHRGLPVLTWPHTRTDIPLPAVAAEPVRAVLTALAQAGDLVVVDLPRALDEAATEALALANVTLMVVPAEVRASAAASQLAAAVRLVTPDLRVVVRLPAPGGLEPLDITDVMGGLPLAGVIGADRRLSAAAEHGEPPGSSARGSVSAFCRSFLDDLFGLPSGRRGSESRAAA